MSKSKDRGATFGGNPGRPLNHRVAGYTLVEVGLVIGLMGLLAVTVADHYLSQLRYDRSHNRVEGTVADVRSIIDAAILWRESHLPSLWPHEANVIDAKPLVDDGYLPFLPPNRYRYFECGNAPACTEFELTGWDRSMPGGPPPDYTDDPLEAEDLVVQFNVWGLAEAKLIASQLPVGRVLAQVGNQLGTEAHTVEARILIGSLGGDYVRITGESRPVVFSSTIDPVTNDLQPEGDLQLVGRITGGAPPTGTTQADNISEAVTPGIRLEPENAQMNNQGSFGGRVVIDGPLVIRINADDLPPGRSGFAYEGITYEVLDSSGQVTNTYTLGQDWSSINTQLAILAADLAAHATHP